jgi:hypothetical protein
MTALLAAKNTGWQSHETLLSLVAFGFVSVLWLVT